MNDQYLDAFIRETEESITDLNNSLLAMESDPDDEEAMDEIFRTAHTLKGNFGAMGFDDASDLAHALEDLLDEFRAGEMEPTPELMDLIFEGVDQIELIVSQIEESGEANVDTSDTVDAVRAAIDEGIVTTEGGADAATTDASSRPDEAANPSSSLDPDAFGAALDDADVEGPLVGVEVDLAGADMPGIDATFVLDTAVEDHDVVGTDPAPEAIREGDFGETFKLVVRGDDADGLAEAIGDHSKVTGAAGVALGSLADGNVSTDEASEDEATAEPAPDGAEESPDDDAAPDSDLPTTDESDGPAVSPGAPGDGPNGSGGAGDSGRTGGSGDAGGSDVGEIKSVRIDVDQLDDLHGMVEQLVTSRIKLRQATEAEDIDAAAENLDELDKITSNLQNTVMDMRLIPVKKAVNKFPRLVRDLARDQGKEIDFTMEGTDVELDRTILDEVSDPLMHVIRNAVDHGIEPPEERKAKGKPREGQIRLEATRERDHVTISVSDDGAGLDVERIKQEAIEEGVRTPAEIESMDDSEIYDLIYHPGFSTTDEVTDVSGRGVGMDVVHKTVSRLDGSVSVESTPDEGSTVSLRLPVSVAIVKVLFVRVGEEEYGIPIKNIDEISRSREVETINGTKAVEHDGSIYPVVNLGDALDVDGARPNGHGMFVRVRESVRPVVLHCSSVDAQKEVVIKPFQGTLSGVEGLSGTAVVGDGKVVPILDVVTL